MSEDKRAALAALELERRARKMGVSAECAQWLGWLWRPDINIRPTTVMTEDGTSLTPGRQEPASLTPSRRERPTQPPRLTEVRTPQEPTEWLKFSVTVRDPGDNDPGAVMEAEWGVGDGELVVRDLDGVVLARQCLVAGADPRRLARVLLRGRSPRKGNVIQFPKMGVA